MSLDRPTILLADDDPTIADSLAPFLERAGFHVLVVSDGVNALKKAQAHHPELIILDVLMPRMDGREALRRLRKANIWTPTILLRFACSSREIASKSWMHLLDGADIALPRFVEAHRIELLLAKSEHQPAVGRTWFTPGTDLNACIALKSTG